MAIRLNFMLRYFKKKKSSVCFVNTGAIVLVSYIRHLILLITFSGNEKSRYDLRSNCAMFLTILHNSLTSGVALKTLRPAIWSTFGVLT